MIGIHDGSTDGVINVAAIINRPMFFEFILACTAYLVRRLWPNEKKDKIHNDVLAKLA